MYHYSCWSYLQTKSSTGVLWNNSEHKVNDHPRLQLYRTKEWIIQGKGNIIFLHNRPWISLWIKSISNELDITVHMIASQLSGHCDVISNRLWHHQQNVNLTSEARGRSVKTVIFIVILSSLCRVRNKIIYVLSWQTVSVLTRVLFWCLFPSLLRNSGNKHQNNPLVMAETVRHSSTYTIPYILQDSPSGHLSM